MLYIQILSNAVAQVKQEFGLGQTLVMQESHEWRFYKDLHGQGLGPNL